MKIAHSRPFEGAPLITAASVFGSSPGKPFMWRIPVLGKRPITISAKGLPDGLTLCGNTIRGITAESGSYQITLKAENELGACEKKVSLKIARDGLLLTPLLGFTTWNACAADVSREFVTDTARLLVDTGLAEYGYSYMNIDSGWQGEYGGAFDAIQPNSKFPDMSSMCAELHASGLKCGIYSTPMLTAWGCPSDMKSIPGCTRGEPDCRFADTNGGIGRERMEENNARQWSEWGFDYLKYDWCPSDPVNAEYMKKALLRQQRDFAFCTTGSCGVNNADYWKSSVNSWRDNDDTFDYWENIVRRLETVDVWAKYVAPGHFYDLDMLAIGAMSYNNGVCRLTEDEMLFAYTMHAFFPSPVQLSCRLDKLTKFEFDLFTNKEIIAVNQDSLCDYPKCICSSDENGRKMKIYKRRLEDNSFAVAVFNLSDEPLSYVLELGEPYKIRELWSKTDMDVSSRLDFDIGAHSARVYKLSE